MILSLLGWIAHLIPSYTTYIWTTNQRSSIQAVCEGCEDKRGRGSSANPFYAIFKTALWPESSSEHRRFQSLQRELCSDEYFGAMGQGKASHGLALLCWGFDQPSFNLLSWVWFSFCTLSSGPPLRCLYFEVGGRLMGRRAIGNRRTTVKLVKIVFIFCTLNYSTSPHSHTWALQMFPYLWVSDIWVNKCGLKTNKIISP